ncbi:TPM domain-containing protein [Pseudomonas graminis]
MRFSTLILLAVLPFASLAATVDVPTLQQRVTDEAGVLSATDVQQITTQIVALEKKTGHQLAVLTVDTTGDDSIEQYATRVFDAWKLGDKQRDDGLLLVMAKTDRTVRIEVGYGLEGDFTDVQAARVINGSIIPHFKQGEMGPGLVAGVQSISRQLGVPVEGDAPAVAPSPAPEPDLSPNPNGSTSISGNSAGLWILGMIILPIVFRRRNPLFRALLVSGSVTGISWLSTLLTSGAESVNTDNLGLLFGASVMVQMLIASLIGALTGGGRSSSRSDSSSDDRSDSSRDSGSSDGGFSGGGGRSGGGGASGKW